MKNNIQKSIFREYDIRGIFRKKFHLLVINNMPINFENGWGLVRASNTTPVLVTRFESTDKTLAKSYEKSVNALIIKAKEQL